MRSYDNVQDFIQGLRARPYWMWLNSPAIQTGSQPGSRYMPLCSCPPAALRHCSARKSGQMVLTQTYYNNLYHPHLESYVGIKTAALLCKSSLYPYTPTMADLYRRPTADPECPSHEHPQVPQMQVWRWTDLYSQVYRSHKRLVLQTLCWIMLSTGAFAMIAVMISSIYSLFYLMVNCRMQP